MSLQHHSGTSRVGPYRLVRELGQGGMGVVHLAERDDQFHQRVVRHGLDTPDLLERFLAEGQILASLSHPHIARLLGGGVTDDGRPYLVLEYVEGEPIDDYCKRLALSVRDRVRLFLQVAVHYATGTSSSTATSSRPTSSSAPTARPSSWTSASPRSWTRACSDTRRRAPAPASG